MNNCDSHKCPNLPLRGKGPEVLAVSWIGYVCGGKPLPGAGGQVPSLVLLLADLSGNKKGSEKKKDIFRCLLEE